MAVMAKFAALPRSIPTILNRKPDALLRFSFCERTFRVVSLALTRDAGGNENVTKILSMPSPEMMVAGKNHITRRW